ncbi:MAG: hypothetical protein H6704_13375 [Myxococcales bacterium]|nr:hypothetical protein [Myxococcales bacterium]
MLEVMTTRVRPSRVVLALVSVGLLASCERDGDSNNTGSDGSMPLPVCTHDNPHRLGVGWQASWRFGIQGIPARQGGAPESYSFDGQAKLCTLDDRIATWCAPDSGTAPLSMRVPDGVLSEGSTYQIAYEYAGPEGGLHFTSSIQDAEGLLLLAVEGIQPFVERVLQSEGFQFAWTPRCTLPVPGSEDEKETHSDLTLTLQGVETVAPLGEEKAFTVGERTYVVKLEAATMGLGGPDVSPNFVHLTITARP